MAKQRTPHICKYCTNPVREYWQGSLFKGYYKTCETHFDGYSHRTGPENPRWKGGRHITKDGYVKVLDWRRRTLKGASRYTLEHRLVMETTLDRDLASTEIVHHLNGIRTDNRPENLVVIQGPYGHETWTLHRALQARIRALEEQLAR